jgi:hypothetical protein
MINPQASMADPVPEKFITLPEAVASVTAKIADRDIEVARRDLPLLYEIFGLPLAAVDLTRLGTKPMNVALREWTKRELAIREIYFALQKGALKSFIRAPPSGEIFRLTAADWRHIAIWQHTIRGGVIHSVTGESIGRHHGRRVLVEEAAFNRWLTAARTRKPAGGFREFCDFLENQMRQSPKHKLRQKFEWQRIAKELFGVPRRKFLEAWRSKIKKTDANWDLPGAPLKPPQ